MIYLLAFLEGIITFISPCLLPMLPMYILYFAGGKTDERNDAKTFVNALGFVLGFTIVFVALGVFAGALGGLLIKYQTAVNLVTGLIIVMFGLNYIGVLQIDILNRTFKPDTEMKEQGFFAAVLFGIIFSVGWTPCVGTFLGSALLMASQQGSAMRGLLMLLLYSLGLGLPFLVSALLIDRLKGTFGFIKKYYRIVNRVCGILLVVTGVLMMTGIMNRLIGLLA